VLKVSTGNQVAGEGGNPMRLRLLAWGAVLGLLVALFTPMAALAQVVTTEDKIHVENLTVVLDQYGIVTIDGLVVCDFASTEPAEVAATLTQHGIFDYSNGDFTYCGSPLDVGPLGGNHVTNYLYFKPGRALLHLAFGLCDTAGTVCGSYSFDGYVRIRKA
jgi:hypothetical protein